MNREVMIQLEKEHGQIIQQASDFQKEIEESGKMPSGEDTEKYEKMCLAAEQKQAEFKSAREWVDRQERLASQAAWRDEVQRIQLPEPKSSVPETSAPSQQATQKPGEEKIQTGTATPEYSAAFGDWLQTGRLSQHLYAGIQTAADTPARTDIDPRGGYVIPDIMAGDVIKEMDRAMPLRTMVRTISNVAPGQTFLYPYRKTRIGRSKRTGETGGTPPSSIPTLEERSWVPTLMWNETALTHTALAQTAFNYDAFLMDELIYAMEYDVENEILNGTGGPESDGLLNPSASGISTSRDANTGSTTKEFTWKGLHAAKYEHMRPVYHASMTLLLSSTAQGLIRTLQTPDGQFAWQPSAQLGAPPRFDDVPVRISEFMPATFTSGRYVGIFGVFSNYLLVDSGAISIQRLVELEARSNQVVIIGRKYFYGAPTLEEAFVRLKVGNIS